MPLCRRSCDQPAGLTPGGPRCGREGSTPTIKIVSIADEHTRECLGGLVDRNITSDDLIAELGVTRLAAPQLLVLLEATAVD
jgi:hypothetical protein